MEYPYTAEALQQMLVPEHDAPWAEISDREWWSQRAETSLGSGIKAAVLAEASRLTALPIVAPRLTEALDFARTGDREAWQNRMFELVHRASVTVMAAGFEPTAERIDEAANALWAVSEVSNWVMPAHRGYETSESPGFDLAAAMRGQEVAEAVRVMGGVFGELSPRIGEKFRRDLEERVFQPFVTRDYWFTYRQGSSLNNWTAVCAAGAALAALSALDKEPEWQATVVAKAVASLGYFLETFGDAGSLDEGVGYWSYGFSYYAMAAERIYARTAGQVDLLADPLWKEVAQFPLRINLYNGRYPQFSDCAARVYPSSGVIAFLGQHLRLPNLTAWAAELAARPIDKSRFSLPVLLRNLAWQPKQDAEGTEGRSLSVFLPDVQWFLARSRPDEDALVFAVKAGHNAENHNHNDGGSFVVHFQQEPFIDELGSPTYTRQFFERATRYQNIAARSLGHSVPFVNGTEQSTGREYEASVLKQDSEGVELELSKLYPEAARLVSLRRSLRVDRNLDCICLKDEAEFEDVGNTFALPLVIIDRQVSLENGLALIHGTKGQLEVSWEPDTALVRFEELATEDSRFLDEAGKSKIRRLWFELPVPGKTAVLQITMQAQKA